jgi:hypothetical protein
MSTATEQTNLSLSRVHKDALVALKRKTGLSQTTLVEVGIELLCKRFGHQIRARTLVLKNEVGV